MKLIVFDCDGTLVDSQHLIVEAMNAAFEAASLEPPSRRQTLSIVGLSLPQAMQALLPDAGPAVVATLAEKYKSAFHDLRKRPDTHEPLYPDVTEVITALGDDPNVLLGVATGKSRRGLEIVLKHHDLRDHFFTLHTADDGPSKPNPHMLQKAIAAAGVTPEQTVMIGDTTFDIRMGRSAGTRTIAVSWGYHDEADLWAAKPDAMSHAFNELPQAISDVLGA